MKHQIGLNWAFIVSFSFLFQNSFWFTGQNFASDWCYATSVAANSATDLQQNICCVILSRKFLSRLQDPVCTLKTGFDDIHYWTLDAKVGKMLLSQLTFTVYPPRLGPCSIYQVWGTVWIWNSPQKWDLL